MNTLSSQLSTLRQEGLDFDLDREDGIPYLSIWRTDGVMPLAQAMHLARLVQDAADGTVHFHRLEGTSVSFFIFSAGEGHADWMLEEYGTPLQDWLQAVLVGLPAQ